MLKDKKTPKQTKGNYYFKKMITLAVLKDFSKSCLNETAHKQLIGSLVFDTGLLLLHISGVALPKKYPGEH